MPILIWIILVLPIKTAKTICTFVKNSTRTLHITRLTDIMLHILSCVTMLKNEMVNTCLARNVDIVKYYQMQIFTNICRKHLTQKTDDFERVRNDIKQRLEIE